MERSTRLFVGCFVALVATAFGFIIRALILDDFRSQFNLSQEQIGYINGAGLYPFAISIILLSLVVDRLGYGRGMVLAFAGHVLSAILTIFATSFTMLYLATFLFALANGVVEAVINPVVATIYDRQKTHWLNVLHAGWPGGLVLGGLLTLALGSGESLGGLPGALWQWKVALVLLPTLLYGYLLLGLRFPVQERVAAGVSYLEMLKEFGTASAYVVSFLLIAGINQILAVLGVGTLSLGQQLFLALLPTLPFALAVRSFGRPMFVFLLLVMFLLATTELGTDGWIADIMSSVLDSPLAGSLVLIYTSFIMFVLRFAAGPIVHRISPLGLLACCAAVAAAGLLWLANAGTATVVVFAAATLYAVGKTYFWPTTLGVVSEQFPRGGALMMNAIAGVGMLAVGALGTPAIGKIQDDDLSALLQKRDPSLHQRVTTEQPGIFGPSVSLDQEKRGRLGAEQQRVVAAAVAESSQGTLAKIALLPAIMLVSYLGLILYFRSRGGYRAVVLREPRSGSG